MCFFISEDKHDKKYMLNVMLPAYSGHCVSFKYGTNAVAMTAFITITSSIITTLFTHTELTPP